MESKAFNFFTLSSTLSKIKFMNRSFLFSFIRKKKHKKQNGWSDKILITQKMPSNRSSKFSNKTKKKLFPNPLSLFFSYVRIQQYHCCRFLSLWFRSGIVVFSEKVLIRHFLCPSNRFLVGWRPDRSLICFWYP